MPNERVELLENRLLNYSISVIAIAEELPQTKFWGWLSDQVSRSAVSAALNYAEARGAESRRDFIHKMKVSLKELRESHCSLKLIRRYKETKETELGRVESASKEGNELISIFVSSIKTAISKQSALGE